MPKVETRHKTISYRRATFLTGTKNSLQGLLTKFFTAKPHIEDRRVSRADGLVLEERHLKSEKGVGLFLHIAGYTPGEPASIVPKAEGVDQADLETAPPPKDTDYMDGDMMVLVADNHVLICSSSLHEKTFTDYLNKLLIDAGFLVEDEILLTRVADIDKTKLLAQGIKEVHLNSSLFEASIDHAKRKAVSRKIVGGVMDELMAIFEKDKNLSEIMDEENLSAEVVFKFDSRKKGGEVAKARLQKLAEVAAADDDESAVFITMNGNKIRGSDVSLKKAVNIKLQGKSVFYDDAFKELRTYYLELDGEGLLEV